MQTVRNLIFVLLTFLFLSTLGCYSTYSPASNYGGVGELGGKDFETEDFFPNLAELSRSLDEIPPPEGPAPPEGPGKPKPSLAIPPSEYKLQQISPNQMQQYISAKDAGSDWALYAPGHTYSLYQRAHQSGCDLLRVETIATSDEISQTEKVAGVSVQGTVTKSDLRTIEQSMSMVQSSTITNRDINIQNMKFVSPQEFESLVSKGEITRGLGYEHYAHLQDDGTLMVSKGYLENPAALVYMGVYADIVNGMNNPATSAKIRKEYADFRKMYRQRKLRTPMTLGEFVNQKIAAGTFGFNFDTKSGKITDAQSFTFNYIKSSDPYILDKTINDLIRRDIVNEGVLANIVRSKKQRGRENPEKITYHDLILAMQKTSNTEVGLSQINRKILE